MEETTAPAPHAYNLGFETEKTQVEAYDQQKGFFKKVTYPAVTSKLRYWFTQAPQVSLPADQIGAHACVLGLPFPSLFGLIESALEQDTLIYIEIDAPELLLPLLELAQITDSKATVIGFPDTDGLLGTPKPLYELKANRLGKQNLIIAQSSHTAADGFRVLKHFNKSKAPSDLLVITENINLVYFLIDQYRGPYQCIDYSYRDFSQTPASASSQFILPRYMSFHEEEHNLPSRLREILTDHPDHGFFLKTPAKPGKAFKESNAQPFALEHLFDPKIQFSISPTFKPSITHHT